MNRPALLLVALSVLAGAAPVEAQQLAAGTWTGTMTPPDGEPVPVTYVVSHEGGVPSVLMESLEVEGTMEFFDVQLEGDQLTFWWDPGVRVECALMRGEDGAFEGPCRDGTAGEGAIRMVPPEV